MDIETLKNFIVIAESDSISQAARKLYVAQSALSNRLKALEKSAGRGSSKEITTTSA